MTAAVKKQFGVERYFSLLANLSDSRRQRMKLETLERLFFLQCNSHVHDTLCRALAERLDSATHEIATNILSSSRRAEEQERKRRQALDRAMEMSLLATKQPSAESIAELTRRAAAETQSIGLDEAEEEKSEQEEEVKLGQFAADSGSDEAELSDL
jgi:hypothetical protein